MATPKKADPKTTKTPDNALMVLASGNDAAIPDYLKHNGPARGAENVSTDDLVIPRLEVVQSLSPCRNKKDPNFIEGAEEGVLYNNVTRELYGENVFIIPVYFRKEWLIWKSRDSGGGFRGAFNTETEAKIAIDTLEDGEDCEAVDTSQFFCLLVNPANGKVEEIVVSMAKSKAKVARKWNSLIRLNGGDSFSRVYKLATIDDKNSKNQDFKNLVVSSAGFPTQELYKRAETLYDQIVAGAVQVDRKQEVSEPTNTEY